MRVYMDDESADGGIMRVAARSGVVASLLRLCGRPSRWGVEDDGRVLFIGDEYVKMKSSRACSICLDFITISVKKISGA
ncbi:hypothetical protein Dimus_033443, partial [Dionaea muscipula]